jgi:hypothetical protein
VIIAMLGLPGAGKSTLARALAELLDADALLEPDEAQWPEFVVHPHVNGAFTRLSWFRSQRVPLYYAAKDSAARGHAAILDSYYDKWCVGWLGRPGLEWLIEPDDPYMPVARQMASTDHEQLPAADVVIMLEIDEQQWLEQLASRGRVIDRHDPFLRSHRSQAHFVETALEFGPRDGTVVIRHLRARVPPRDEACQLLEQLQQRGFAAES